MQRIISYTCLLMIVLSYACSTRTTTVKSQEKLALNSLLDTVQYQTFQYFWEGGDKTSGAAYERIHMDNIYPSDDRHIVTSGGTGFGIMATLVGVKRNYITRKDAYDRLSKLANWLEKSDRFKGAWPHWMDGKTGKTKPFSQYDDGGDLVETAFLAQGLITARQFFKDGTEEEIKLAEKLDKLWKEIDWDWYTQNEDVLYWHWSPNHGFKMNFDVRGYNECLIMYILAASSPTHPVKPEVYHKGFMMEGKGTTDRVYYDIPTLFNHYETNDMAVGPLFWAHYSYLGLDPHQLKDPYVDFWQANVNHVKIHHRHCSENPYEYEGYSDKCWGLTSSYSMNGYAGHNPQEDLGVISPTAALSSFPYTPEESMKFLRYLYDERPELIGKYGPYDAFSDQSRWSVKRYLAIDQLPIPIMIENYRSGMLWDLFMSAPEIQAGLDKLDFQYRKVPTI